MLELDRETVPVRGDAVGLRRLLLNLVLNARDAVGEAGGRIVVRVVHAAGRAVLEVEDDGPGIDPEIRARLFEPFFTLRRQGRGSGLGLAVVHSIVTAHDGEVDVRSQPGDGTRFIVRLPLGEIGRLEPVESRRAAPAGLPRVLLVETDGGPPRKSSKRWRAPVSMCGMRRPSVARTTSFRTGQPRSLWFPEAQGRRVQAPACGSSNCRLWCSTTLNRI